MMRSLFSGVSGLKSHQTRMDVIGNNISNINTVGFKSSRTTFADMLSQTSKGASSPTGTIGGTNPTQIGLGTAVASVDLITNDGSPQNTGKNTDVALSGNGMFVLKRGESYYYTRDGAFEFDNDGNYVLPGSGYYVQGWNAVEGSLNTNADPTNIVVPAGRAMPAAATTAVDFNGNLNASSPIITSITYTSGGVSIEDELSVVNGYTISGITYDVTYNGQSMDSTTSVATEFTDGIAIGEEIAPPFQISYVDSSSQTVTTTVTIADSYKAKVSTVTLTLGNPNDPTDTRTVTVPATDKTSYKVFGSNSMTSGEQQYIVGNTTYNITGISYTATVEGIQAQANETFTDTVIMGSYSQYSGTTLMGLTTSAVHLSLTDANGSGATNTVDITSGSGTSFKTGTAYVDSAGRPSKVESVNVDGQNVIAAILTFNDGSTQKVTSGFYEVGHSMPVTTIVTIYDSEGKTHAVTMLIDKDSKSTDPRAATDANIQALDALGVNNRWRMYLAPAVGEKGPSSYFKKTETDDGSTTEGIFNPQHADDPTSKEGAVSFIYFNDDGSYNAAATTGGQILLRYDDGNGAADTTSSVNYTGLTQYSGNSTAYPTADGNSFGVLQSVSIDTAGVLTGTYTNGILRFEAQIAVAQFVNPAGLTKTGTSLYQQSNNSGSANIKTVTDLGLSITPSALEMSNVDLAAELADMIVTQRGFQSNSKVITVGDEMLETLINMKR